MLHAIEVRGQAVSMWLMVIVALTFAFGLALSLIHI